MEVEEIMDKFYYRKCPFAVKTKAGFYIPVYRDVTYADIKKHLEGGHTIGAYNSREDGTCKWACIDFDDKQYEKVARQIAKQEVIFKDTEIGHSYGEDIDVEILFEESPSKGYHVWFLFGKAVKTVEAYYWLLSIIQNNKLQVGTNAKIDMFPRAPELTGKRVSWQVRVPRFN